jgi:phosphatidylglycerol:prolipoprotein diacylglycerol transferase
MLVLASAILLPSFDPVAFHLGPLAIRWYGLAYLVAFALALWGLRQQVRTGWLRLTEADVSELLTWGVVGVVIGGRLGWWLIYSRPDATTPWYEPLAIWNGGMSFHGGLVGVGLAIMLWCRRRRISVAHVTDAVALVTPIGLFLGRIANFINGELVGRASSLPWAVQFPGESIARHPSQLYEAGLEGIVLGALLLVIARRRPGRDGRVAATFIAGYGIARFAVEFTREPDVQIGFIAGGWLTMGQLLSLTMAAAGVAWFLFFARKDRRPAGAPAHETQVDVCPPPTHRSHS